MSLIMIETPVSIRTQKDSLDMKMDCLDRLASQERDLGNESFPSTKTTTPPKRKEQKPTAISLFSGGGGLDLGIEAAGFETLACIEKDENCCETLKSNQSKYLKSAKIINDDVDNVDVRKLMKELKIRKGSLDLLFGGPPCQTFSQIGKKESVNDARGRLLFSMVNYASILNPKAVLIENVAALQNAKDSSGEKGAILRDLINQLEGLGYVVSHQVLNAAEYGVAQLRKRLFVVAVRKKETFEFPVGSFGDDRENPFVHVGEVIQNLPGAVPKDSDPLHANHVDVTPAGDIRRISHVTEGAHLAKMHDAPSEIRGRLSKKDTTKFLRLSRSKPSNTLRCGEIFFHPIESRYLTPREYMRIHGFPDDYVLKGPIRGRSGSVRNLDQHRQVANSVPPQLGEQVAKSILDAIRKPCPSGRGAVTVIQLESSEFSE
ncbi:DNA cytosine methyltransferase [Roseibium sp. RKSG952]|uniref:DNA cytosine methyltransferase n=1 Tax=Roseibium sp. RKSG952 TaxID=2529384 RepID=UPI0012BC3AF3|nr:DNA cytosine methyltransferase [Roseibium sp. RKSG952]MTH95082.1 DNA cytosine methyltransferase [Roseibium sp. RKSG952]